MKKVLPAILAILILTSCGRLPGGVEFKIEENAVQGNFKVMAESERNYYCHDPVSVADRIVVTLKGENYYHVFTLSPSHTLKVTNLDEGSYSATVVIYRGELIIAWGESGDFRVHEGKIKEVKIALVCQEEWQ